VVAAKRRELKFERASSTLRRVTKPYRHEWLVLALICATAFTFYHGGGAQDVSRLALTQSLVADRSLQIDRWHDASIDKARYNGHYYSDKAPGMSFLAIPSYLALRTAGFVDSAEERAGIWEKQRMLWVVRLLTGGLGFLLVVFLVGRVAEGIAPGTGAATAATFGLGTLAFPLAATVFGHVVAAALAFAAFVLAWSGALERHSRHARLFAGGLLAGLAVLVEYQAAVIALALVVYVATRTPRGALVFVAGGLPSAVLLALYNTAAFDSPLHFSYSYVDERFAENQSTGLFGIATFDLERMWYVLFSWKGLLVQSPVLVLAVAGLALLWRRGARAEAALCATIAVLFLGITAGYYDPIGGLSPGPRFFVPALPFLAVGLPCAFRKWPVVSLLAASISVASMMYWAGTWSRPDGERFVTVWTELGAPWPLAALVLGLLALGALALGAKSVLAAYGPTLPGWYARPARPR